MHINTPPKIIWKLIDQGNPKAGNHWFSSLTSDMLSGSSLGPCPPHGVMWPSADALQCLWGSLVWIWGDLFHCFLLECCKDKMSWTKELWERSEFNKYEIAVLHSWCVFSGKGLNDPAETQDNFCQDIWGEWPAPLIKCANCFTAKWDPDSRGNGSPWGGCLLPFWGHGSKIQL